MCIAIHKPAGADISTERLENCWYNNDDGAGFMYSRHGQLFVRKGFMFFEDFLQAYISISDRVDLEMVIHFRTTTHGVTTEKNTHPFFVFPKRLAFVHNGIISGLPNHKFLSDTQLFNNKVLKQLPHNFLNNSAIIKLIEEYIGWSRLVFMTSDGDVTVIGPGEHDENGVWYSNSDWRLDKYYYGRVDDSKLGRDNQESDFPSQFWGTYYCPECGCFFEEIDIMSWDRKNNGYPLCPECGGDMVITEDDKEVYEEKLEEIAENQMIPFELQ